MIGFSVSPRFEIQTLFYCITLFNPLNAVLTGLRIYHVLITGSTDEISIFDANPILSGL